MRGAGLLDGSGFNAQSRMTRLTNELAGLDDLEAERVRRERAEAAAEWQKRVVEIERIEQPRLIRRLPSHHRRAPRSLPLKQESAFAPMINRLFQHYRHLADMDAASQNVRFWG